MVHTLVQSVWVIMRVLRWDEGIQKHEKNVLGPEMCIVLLIWFFPVLLQAGGGGKLYYFFPFILSVLQCLARCGPSKNIGWRNKPRVLGTQGCDETSARQQSLRTRSERRRRAEKLYAGSRLLRLCLLTFLLWLLYKQKRSRSMLCSGRSFQSWLGWDFCERPERRGLYQPRALLSPDDSIFLSLHSVVQEAPTWGPWGPRKRCTTSAWAKIDREEICIGTRARGAHACPQAFRI